MLVGEGGQQPTEVLGGSGGVQPETAAGPVLEPAETAGDHVELGPVLLPVQQEPRWGDPFRKRGHAVGPSPADQEPVGAGLPHPLLQPPVPDRAAQPQPLQNASHVGEIPLRCGKATRHHHLSRQREVQITGEIGDSLRVLDHDLGGGSPREFQGAAQP
ncbi:hypothetical protein SVIOM74S_08234 [Streptomyces violarus]